MNLERLTDKLDDALRCFGLIDDFGGISRKTIRNKDHWRDFLKRKEAPYIHLYTIYVYAVDDESFTMEIHDDDGDIALYNRRTPSTIIELFIRQVFEYALYDYIKDGDFDHEQ